MFQEEDNYTPNRFFDQNNKKYSKSGSFSDMKTLTTIETLPENSQILTQLAEKECKLMQAFAMKNYTLATEYLNSLRADLDGCGQKISFKDLDLRQYKLYICLYNLAVILSKQKQIQAAEAHLGQAAKLLQKIIDEAMSKQLHLALTVEHVKLSLQYCVIMSQSGNHAGAIKIGSLTISTIIECFKIMKAMTEELMSQTRRRHRKIEGLVNFRAVVLKQAEQKLNILQRLEPPGKLLDEPLERLNYIAKNLYVWKENVQNNEKYMRKQLSQQSEKKTARSLLGIAKNPSWTQNFHMGNIMTINMRNFDFMGNLDPFLFLSENYILELVILASASYFTISTEMRLKQQNRLDQGANQSTRFIKIRNNKNFTHCKILHLKSIQLVSTFLPFSTKYLTHLISSFNKNYKFLMEQISEEQSTSQSIDASLEENYQTNAESTHHTHHKDEETMKSSKFSKKRRLSTSGSHLSLSKKSENKKSFSKKKKRTSSKRNIFYK